MPVQMKTERITTRDHRNLKYECSQYIYHVDNDVHYHGVTYVMMTSPRQSSSWCQSRPSAQVINNSYQIKLNIPQHEAAIFSFSFLFMFYFVFMFFFFCFFCFFCFFVFCCFFVVFFNFYFISLSHFIMKDGTTFLP